MKTKRIPDELARANWFALCDLAQVAPDTKRTPAELVERLRANRAAHWDVRYVERAIAEYEATL